MERTAILNAGGVGVRAVFFMIDPENPELCRESGETRLPRWGPWHPPGVLVYPRRLEGRVRGVGVTWPGFLSAWESTGMQSGGRRPSLRRPARNAEIVGTPLFTAQVPLHDTMLPWPSNRTEKAITRSTSLGFSPLARSFNHTTRGYGRARRPASSRSAIRLAQPHT